MVAGGEGEQSLSARLEAWLTGEQRKTTGDIVERFGHQSFAILFVILLAVPALPIPTAGVTHVLEVMAMLLALELVLGREEVWIPKRWNDKELPALSRPAFARGLLKRIRWVERFARPRGARLLAFRVTTRLYGLLVFFLSLIAFLAPPFSGLDTLPAMGVVVLSLGVLFRDALTAGLGILIGMTGVALVIGLGSAITRLL
jgi:hypothetical protein